MSDGALRFSTLARTLRPVLVAVFAVTLVVVVVLGFRVQTALKTLQEQPNDNFHWNITQLELDLVRLAAEMRLAQALPDSSLDELRKRFDLFYSRAQNAMSGKGYMIEGLETISWDIAVMLSDYLKRTTPTIDGADAALLAALPAMTRDAEDLRIKLRKSSITLLEGLAVQNDTRRADFAILFHRLTLALIAAGLLFAAFLGVVLWLNADAARQSRQSARLSKRLSSTIDRALDAIIVIDSHGRVLQYNPSAETVFGFPRHEVIGQDLAQLIIPERLRGAHSSGMERMRRTGEMKMVNSGRFQTVALAQSGREFPVEVSISDAQGDDGQIFIAFLRDITDRLAAEAELTVARDKALAAERAKSNFLAVMSHEMRTPLNGVMASLEIAARKATDPDQARFITLAQDSASQLLRHANDVLDITRLEAGGLALTLADFSLGKTLQTLADSIRPLCDQKGITFTVDLIGELPSLHGDAFRLAQIVQNFLSNAVKFAQQGAITLEAEVVESRGTTRMIEIRVIDTGPGILEADQARIFEDFVMLDPTFGRSGAGAGLGLAISRRLAHAMGGEVGVESVPGEGSCFWLRLSLPLASQTADPSASGKFAPAPPRTDLPRLKVLVVEDNATNRIVLEEMLGQLGQDITLAHDGQSGADAARASAFDLILMDISMPVMDGLTAARLVRAEGASRGARILAVTAHSLPSDVERFRAAGMDDVLVKPISLADLTAALEGQSTVSAQSQFLTLDLARLNELGLALGTEGTARVKERFLADGRALLERLAPLLASDPLAAETLANLCHEAAGLSAVLGASRLREHFSTAEQLCRSGKLAEAADMLRKDSDRLWSDVVSALKQS